MAIKAQKLIKFSAHAAKLKLNLNMISRILQKLKIVNYLLFRISRFKAR